MVFRTDVCQKVGPPPFGKGTCLDSLYVTGWSTPSLSSERRALKNTSVALVCDTLLPDFDSSLSNLRPTEPRNQLNSEYPSVGLYELTSKASGFMSVLHLILFLRTPSHSLTLEVSGTPTIATNQPQKKRCSLITPRVPCFWDTPKNDFPHWRMKGAVALIKWLPRRQCYSRSDDMVIIWEISSHEVQIDAPVFFICAYARLPGSAVQSGTCLTAVSLASTTSLFDAKFDY